MADSDIFSDWLRRWNLSPDGPGITTPFAKLLPVRRGREAAMLKVMGAASDEAPAARALRHFAGRCAVRVLEEGDGGILLERAIPGTPLTDVVAEGRDDEATGIIAEAIAALHRDDPPAGSRTLEDWGDGFRRQRARGPHPALPAVLLDRGEAVWRELAASQGRRFLLHADLHHDNLLLSERGWLAIDPKGIVGEAAFEPAAMLRNPVRLWPFSADAELMKRRLAILCERLPLDRERVIGWTFGLMVLGACWSIEDRDPDTDVARGVVLADIAARLMWILRRATTRTTSAGMTDPDRLRLAAIDEEDLAVVSAHVQDAVLKVGDLIYLPKERRFALGMNRFVWEKEDGGGRRDHERRRAALIFDQVRKVRSSGIDLSRPDTVLEALALSFEATDAPAGRVTLFFAGGAAVQIDVEVIEARLADLGAAWAARAKPSHDIEAETKARA